MSGEHCYSRSELKNRTALALLLLACGIISASLIFLAFRPPVMIFTMNTF
jgi:hypothetical protein